MGSDADPSSALSVLDRLQDRPRGSRPDYDRDLFGVRWTDTDRNGCDTRNDILRRDLTAVELRPRTRECVVRSGSLQDPYTGSTVSFVRGAQPNTVEVDHVVALADAWRNGAHAWPYAKRLAFANDPIELLATASEVNQLKSDESTDAWLPPLSSARCAFVARQVGVKAKYALTVTSKERAAMRQVLEGCPGTPATTGGEPTIAPNRQPPD